MRENWRDPGFWRWWWRERVPIDAKVVAGLIGLALLFVGGGYAAWNMPDGENASPVDAASSHTFVPPAVQTVQKVVTVRERGRVVRRIVPVVEHVVAPGTPVTETRLETATIVADGATQVVTTERIERVPVVERRVVTIGGEMQTIVTTAPGVVRTATAEGGVTTVVKTVSRPGTATRVSTVVTTVPSAPRTVTADERVTTDVRTVTTQTPGATITRTVTTDGGVGTVTIQQPGVTSTRTITTVQPTTLVSTAIQTTTQMQTTTRTVTTVQPTTVVQTTTETMTITTPPSTVTTTVPTTVTVVVPPKPH